MGKSVWISLVVEGGNVVSVKRVFTWESDETAKVVKATAGLVAG